MSNQFCNNCGKAMDANATFCASCGATRTNPAQPVSQPYASPASNYAPPPVQPTAYYQPVQPAYQNNMVDTQPLRVGEYIIMFIVSGIPLVGFIMLLIWAFGSNANINKKNYSRAVLILAVIGGVLGFLFAGIMVPLIMSGLSSMSGY